MPHSEELEQIILGCAMLDEKVARDLITKEDNIFYNSNHRHILRAMREVITQGSEVDPLILAEYLKKAGILDEIGGAYYLSQLPSMVVAVSSDNINCHFEHYLKLIKNNEQKRFIINGCEEIINDMFSFDGDVSDAMDKLRVIQNRISSEEIKNEIIYPHQIRERRLQDLQHRRNRNPILSGFPSIDEKLSEGFSPGGITTIFGPTSGGKTALKNNLTIRQCLNGMGVLSFVPEMYFVGEMDRLQTIMTQIPLWDFKRIKSWEKDDIRAKQIDENLIFIEKNFKLYIDDSRGITLPNCFTRIEDLKNKGHQIDIVYIDNLKDLPDIAKCMAETKGVMQPLAQMAIQAKRLEVHFIPLAQASRYLYHRPELRPEIGDIEFGSDFDHKSQNIFMILRQNTADKTAEDNKLFLYILKQRDGWVGKIKMDWKKETTTIIDPLESERQEAVEKRQINFNKIFDKR